MEIKQLKAVIELFNHVACLEDDIAPAPADGDSAETKIGKLKQAIKEKKEAVKQTHKALLTLRLESRAKPYTVAASEVWLAEVGEDAAVVAITKGHILDDDGISSYPDGLDVFNAKDIIDVTLENFHDAAMLAVANQAAGKQKSNHAEKIVKALELQTAVDRLKAIQHDREVANSPIQFMWFPVYPYGMWANGPVPASTVDPNAVCPADAFITSDVATTSDSTEA